MAYPKLLHHNIIAQAASVVASSTASGMAVANLSDGRPYTWWGPSAAPASIEVDAGVATEADFLYIPSHTLDSTLWDVSLYAADLPFSGMQLLTAPEDFSNAAWVKDGVLGFGAGSTVNATAAPDGTTTADHVVETALAGVHRVYQVASCSVSTAYTFSCYVKPNARTRIRLLETTLGGASFNLSTGAVISADAGITATISALEANGFYRLSITATTGGAQTTFVGQLSLLDGSSVISYTGDGTSGLYLWGAMFNAGSTAAPYIPVTAGRWISETALCRSNIVIQPQDLSTSGAGGADVTANYAYAPNGAIEATLITDSNAAVAGARTYGSGTEMHYGEAYFCGSVFIRKTTGDAHYAHMHTYVGGGSGIGARAGVTIDTNNGSITAATTTGGAYIAPQDYGIEDAGDYWWVWVQAPPVTTSSGATMRLYIYPAYNTTGSASSSVSATGSKIIWGAKLEKTLGRPAPYRTDAPIFLPFASTTKRYWLLRLNRKSGSALCAMSVCMIGKALTMPTGLPQGYDPVGRKVVGQRNRNERGQPLGTAVDYKWRRQTLRFQALSWAWVRGVFARLWDNGLASEPVGFIWDYEAHVEDVQHVTLGEEFRTPHKSGQLCDLEFDVEGVVE